MDSAELLRLFTDELARRDAELLVALNEKALLKARAEFVAGRDEPTTETAGLLPGDHPDWNDPATDRLTLTDGETITKALVNGDVFLPDDQQKDILLEDVDLVGGLSHPTTDSAIVNASRPRGGTGRLILSNVRVHARTPSPGRNGIRGHRLEVHNAHVSDVVDGIQLLPSGAACDSRVVGGIVEDLTAFSPDTVSNRLWTHNDCLVIGGGTNVEVRGVKVNCTAHAVTGTPPAGSGLAAGFGGQGILVQDTSGLARFDETVRLLENRLSGAMQQTMVKAGAVVGYARNRHSWTMHRSKTAPKWAGYAIRVEDRGSTRIVGLDSNVWDDGPYAGQRMTEPRGRGIDYIR